MSDQRAYQLLNAHMVDRILTAPWQESSAFFGKNATPGDSPFGESQPVANIPEAHARELSPLLPRPQTLREVHAEVQARTGGKPTAADYRQAVDRRLDRVHLPPSPRRSDDAFDLAVYDPPHLPDLGADSIMGKRFGTATGTDGLDRLVTAGALEAWRISRIGILVKLADSSHGGEFLQLSRWVLDQFAMQPYFVAHTTRSQLEDGKWKVQRVPRSNGAVYLVWRKDGRPHHDFDRLYDRQEARRLSQIERQKAAEIARQKPPKFCAKCDTRIPDGRRADARTCSDACRKAVSRRRLEIAS